MREILLISRRELKTFFSSQGSYLVIFFFLIVSSIWFYRINNFLVINRADFMSYFSVFPYLFSIIIPALTMGAWAGEKQEGSYELILTMPLEISQIVAGKFIAVVIESSIILLMTLPVPLSLTSLGEFDTGQIIGEYAGVFMLSSLLISAGLLVSSVSRTQIQAYITSVLIIFVLIIPGMLYNESVSQSTLAGIFNYISPASHYGNFAKGILDTRDIFYYSILTIFCLYANTKKLTIDRWK